MEDRAYLPSDSVLVHRRMVRAQLMGSHTHATLVGIHVHIFLRSGQYLARGRYQGRMFGATLGDNEPKATAQLRELLVEIEDGSFVRPSEQRKRALSNGKVARLTVRQLVSEFLAEKRKVKGRRTANNYRARLRPVLDFAEQPAVSRRWPLAMDVDREFATELRAFLHQHETTRNGRPGAAPKLMSSGQVVNVMECLRTMLSWARRAEVRKLPVTWVNPLTPDLVGCRPAKDPLRPDRLPLESRIRLIGLMDRWQLCHLTLSIVLPLRPEEAVGLLVSDTKFDKGWLEIGTRLGGGDYTKGRTTFVLPFPDEVRAILHTCVGGRAEGPLLRSRQAFEGRGKTRLVSSFHELARLYQARLSKAPPGSVTTEQDRKQLFRALLRKLGGVSKDQLAKECQGLLTAVAAGTGVTLYSLRGSVTTSMERARLPHLELRYLTSHAVGDILNDYVGLDPVGAMRLYFDSVRPLLDAIAERARTLDISVPDPVFS